MEGIHTTIKIGFEESQTKHHKTINKKIDPILAVLLLVEGARTTQGKHFRV